MWGLVLASYALSTEDVETDRSASLCALTPAAPAWLAGNVPSPMSAPPPSSPWAG